MFSFFSLPDPRLWADGLGLAHFCVTPCVLDTKRSLLRAWMLGVGWDLRSGEKVYMMYIYLSFLWCQHLDAPLT